MESLSEGVYSVMSPQTREVRIRTSAFPFVVQFMRERLSKIVYAEWGDNFIRWQLFDETFCKVNK